MLPLETVALEAVEAHQTGLLLLAEQEYLAKEMLAE
jgi:hypothetical protein